MKVRRPSFEMCDVELTAVIELPTAARQRAGMKTTCATCGEQITDELFCAGFAQGQPNRMFHFNCLDDISQTLVMDARENRKAAIQKAAGDL